MNDEFMFFESETLEDAERMSLSFERDSRRYGTAIDAESEAHSDNINYEIQRLRMAA